MSIDVQVQSQSNNIVRLYVNGDNNNSKIWQGKHENGDIDNNETGDNDVTGISLEVIIHCKLSNRR